MNVNELFNKLDYYYEQGRLKEAEDMLNSELATAIEEKNYKLQLSVYNELEGLYRTTGRSVVAAQVCDDALELIDYLNLTDTVHHATTLQNGATANRVAGNLDKALDMYNRAKEIYISLGQQSSYQMASLNHNISLIYSAQKQPEKALASLEKAMNVVSKMADGAPEVATTNVAMAYCLIDMGKMDGAKAKLEAALAYYESDLGQNDGHYSSALSAMGEFLWRNKDLANAVVYYEKALDATIKRFGENYSCKIIRNNIEKIRKEMEN